MRRVHLTVLLVVLAAAGVALAVRLRPTPPEPVDTCRGLVELPQVEHVQVEVISTPQVAPAPIPELQQLTLPPDPPPRIRVSCGGAIVVTDPDAALPKCGRG